MLSLDQTDIILKEVLEKKSKIDKKMLRDLLYQLSCPDRFFFLEQLPFNPAINRKEIDDIFRYVLSPVGLICEVQTDKINDWLKQLLCETLFTSEFNDTQIEAVIETKLKECPSAIKAMSTHQAKLADTKSKTSLYAPVQERISTLPYVCSATLNSDCKQRSIAASSKSVFLETEFIFKGRVTNIVDSLLNEDQNIKAALLYINFKQDQIDSLTNIIKQELNNKDKFFGDFPQTCFPLDNNCEKYMAITGLPAVAVHIQINNRTKKKYIEDPTVFLRTVGCKIGGTKPQNAGSYNLSTGGYQRYLYSNLFFGGSKPDLDKQLRSGFKHKSLFNIYPFNWEFLEKTHSEARNDDMKKFLIKRIDLILEKVCSTYESLKYQVSIGEQLPLVYPKIISLIPNLELKYAHFVVPREPLLSEIFNKKGLKAMNATDQKNISADLVKELGNSIKIDKATLPFNVDELLQTTIERYLFDKEVK